MQSTFLSLQIGASALQASMMGVETAGHNIANANTAGYSREVLDTATMNSLPIYTDHQDYQGQGVIAKGNERISDNSLNAQYRDNNTQQTYWQDYSTEVNGIAQIFNEPSGTTLRNSIDGFFTAWSTLSQTPGDAGSRSAALQATQSMVDAFHTTANTLTQNGSRYQTELNAAVSEVNSIASSIASLNAQIEKAQASGVAPNDLLDQRDAYLNQLSNYAAIKVTYGPDQTNPNVTHMSVELTGNNSPTNDILLVHDGTTTSLTTADVPNLKDQSGQLTALNDLTTYNNNTLTQVDNLASQLVTNINTAQANGYDYNGNSGQNLFSPTGTTAATIQVDSGITSANQLAAAGPNGAGVSQTTDGANASAIAATMTTYDQQYNAIVTKLGTDGQAANQQTQTFQALTTQVTQLQQSLSGVNINDEMTSMVQYQQTYQAASKFISVFNSMLDSLMQNA